jgi:hypothetical protein
MEIKNEIKSLINEHEKSEEIFLKTMELKVKEFFKQFFEENTNIKHITWAQYTPYWNDGSSTEFGTNFYDIFKGGPINDEYEEGDEEYVHVELTKAEQKLESETEEFLSSIPDKVFEHMFNDHVVVKATAEGFDVQHYEHE